MKTKSYPFLFLILITLSGFSQTDMQKFIPRPNSGIISVDLRSRDIEGSRYINDAFLPATFLNNSTIYLLRYNAYQDEMEFEKDAKHYYLVKNSNSSITFTNINKTYQVFTSQENNKQKEGFFVVLNVGNELTLLLKEHIKFFEGISSSFNLTNSQNQLFAKQQEYIQSILEIIQSKVELENALNIF